MPCEPPVAGSHLTLARFTGPELIVADLRETDPAGIIDELSQRLRDGHVLNDALSFYHAVLNQEFLSNSALPVGIALPHARSPLVTRLAIAIGRAAQPVVWGISKSRSVDYVFLVAVPPDKALLYIALLSSIAHLCSNGLLAKLRAATEPGAIYEVLKSVEVQTGLALSEDFTHFSHFVEPTLQQP